MRPHEDIFDYHASCCFLLRHVYAAVRCTLLEYPSAELAPRSDWINVKTDVTPPAKGDGITDDTASLQAALNLLGANVGQKKIVYLPPGRL